MPESSPSPSPNANAVSRLLAMALAATAAGLWIPICAWVLYDRPRYLGVDVAGVVCCLLSVAALFNPKWVPDAVAGVFGEDIKSRQISIAEMFVWTTLVAAIFGLSKWLQMHTPLAALHAILLCIAFLAFRSGPIVRFRMLAMFLLMYCPYVWLFAIRSPNAKALYTFARSLAMLPALAPYLFAKVTESPSPWLHTALVTSVFGLGFGVFKLGAILPRLSRWLSVVLLLVVFAYGVWSSLVFRAMLPGG